MTAVTADSEAVQADDPTDLVSTLCGFGKWVVRLTAACRPARQRQRPGAPGPCRPRAGSAAQAARALLVAARLSRRRRLRSLLPEAPAR